MFWNVNWVCLYSPMMEVSKGEQTFCFDSEGHSPLSNVSIVSA